MNLGIFLGIGESLTQMEKYGQKDRFVNLYLKNYSKNFEKIYLFSYENETCKLPKNVILIPNKTKLHRYLYATLIPILNYRLLGKCDVIRGFGITSSLPAFLTRKPFVFNWAYDYIEFVKLEKKFQYILPYFLLEKLAFLKGNKVLVATKKKFKNLNKSKYIYLPNGVDLKIFRPKKMRRSGLVFVGRLEKQKNLFFLIDSVSLLPINYREISFIGEGSQKKSLIKYAKSKKVDLKIVLTVKNTQLPKKLSKFCIFTLTSYTEGSPKVLLEAMSLGLVPVVTNFETANDIVKNGIDGFIVRYSEKDYSERLLRLIENKKIIDKMSSAAKKKIKKEFDLERLLHREIEILKNINK